MFRKAHLQEEDHWQTQNYQPWVQVRARGPKIRRRSLRFVLTRKASQSNSAIKQEKHPEIDAVSSGAIFSTYQKLRVENMYFFFIIQLRPLGHDLLGIPVAALTNPTSPGNGRLPPQRHHYQSGLLWPQNPTFGKNHSLTLACVHETERLMRHERVWGRRWVRVPRFGLSLVQKKNCSVICFLLKRLDLSDLGRKELNCSCRIFNGKKVSFGT